MYVSTIPWPRLIPCAHKMRATANVAPRLYEPSTLLEIQALQFRVGKFATPGEDVFLTRCLLLVVFSIRYSQHVGSICAATYGLWDTKNCRKPWRKVRKRKKYVSKTYEAAR